MTLGIKINGRHWGTLPSKHAIETKFEKEADAMQTENRQNSLLANCSIITATVKHHELVDKLLTSLKKQVGQMPPAIVILNNGKTIHQPKSEFENTVIIEVDNRESRLAKPMEDQNSHRHCASLDYALKHLVKTKYAVLCDNDILFKPDVKSIFDATPDYDAMGHVCEDIRGHIRLEPYFCVLNIEKMKADGISYYDGRRCWPKLDTGGSFLADVQEKKWRIHETRTDKYIVHLSGAELYNRNTVKWFNENKSLWS